MQQKLEQFFLEFFIVVQYYLWYEEVTGRLTRIEVAALRESQQCLCVFEWSLTNWPWPWFRSPLEKGMVIIFQMCRDALSKPLKSALYRTGRIICRANAEWKRGVSFSRSLKKYHSRHKNIKLFLFFHRFFFLTCQGILYLLFNVMLSPTWGYSWDKYRASQVLGGPTFWLNAHRAHMPALLWLGVEKWRQVSSLSMGLLPQPLVYR